MKRYWAYKKIIIAVGMAIVLVVAALIIVVVSHKGVVSQTPTYQTITPNGETSVIWQRVSPPNTDPVYAYSDNLNGVVITVSEQPLPQSFKQSNDQIAELAKGYNATDIFNAGTTKIYIGTSAQGPQSVIFTKQNLLVLIKSQANIADINWSTYILSLQ